MPNELFDVVTYIYWDAQAERWHITGKVRYEDNREPEVWPLGTALTHQNADRIAANWKQGRRAELQLQAAEKGEHHGRSNADAA